MAWLVAVVLVSAFLVWLVVRHHRRPRSTVSTVAEFSAVLEALAPKRIAPPPPRRPLAPPDRSGGRPIRR